MSKKTSKTKYNKAKRTGRPEAASESFYNKHPLWAFQRCDFDHPEWGMACNADMLNKVFKYLSGLESQSWGEILSATSGRKHNTRNHLIQLIRLDTKAQKRASEINIDEFDGLYSIATQSLMRIWGLITNGVFYVIWFDPKHEIYPTSKT